MSSLLLIITTATIIVLNRCHLSTSFPPLLSPSFTRSRKHFFANKQHHQLHRSSMSLFSTAVIHHLDDSNMNDLLFSSPPDSPSAVLVDAYTQWCGPCKLIEPLLTSASQKYSNQLSILKYDVEGSNHQNLKVELLLKGVRVSGLPTLILFWKGEVVACHSGVISQEGLDDWLDVNLSSNDRLIHESESVSNDHDALMKKKEKEKSQGGEEVTAPKRGFISFASQNGRDDYALSGY